MNRRLFLALASLVSAGFTLNARGATPTNPSILKPRRLKPGDAVGIISPAGATFVEDELNIVVEAVKALNLVPKVGEHALDRYGYLAGKDKDRAADINRFFADPEIALILPIRGGWGCARVLPYLDYELIRRNPKIITGFSDLTSLILAIHAKTGLITFHGPNGFSSWRAPQTDIFRKVLFAGEKLTFENSPDPDDGDRLMRTKNRIRTIVPGRARGRLIGGNLSVLTSIVGSPYLPAFDDAILFVEDIGEDVYKIDRMLTQLKLAGLLDNLAGFIFGQCVNCSASGEYGSFTLEEVIRQHIQPLKIPAWYGASIGHLEILYTLGIGLQVEIDANRGTLTMLEPAVV
ncbi:LD-carboxypeptidase [Pannus brasiliensis CCIBt3594]|uniref:LD-carboxypeptidase n=1 Tax=Pannus brasiliensis CCIBt3594 TaxID=1427578 RepID=A0AAW9QMV7_9CHRO